MARFAPPEGIAISECARCTAAAGHSLVGCSDYDEPDCAFGTALAVMPEPGDPQPIAFDPPLTEAESDAYWDAIRPMDGES